MQRGERVIERTGVGWGGGVRGRENADVDTFGKNAAAVFETLLPSSGLRKLASSETYPRFCPPARGKYSGADRLFAGVISDVYYPNGKHIGTLDLRRANLRPRVSTVCMADARARARARDDEISWTRRDSDRNWR